MSLGTPDANGIGRYEESTPVGTEFSDYLNLALDSVSAVLGRPHQWADAAARAAHTGMRRGDRGIQQDNGILYRYNGAIWKPWESDWIDYSGTVVVTGWVHGTGVGAAKNFSYRWTAGRLRVKWYLGFGTAGASVSALVTFTLPTAAAVPPHSDYGYVGGGEIWDAAPAVKRVNCGVISNGASTTVVKIYTTTLTGNGYDFVTAGVPIAWAVGDAVHGEFEYDPA